MISQVGQPPRLSQSEWIWNRVILTRHQSPVIQSFSLQSRSPKELEVQDRFVRTEMTRKSRWYKVFLPKAEVLWGSRQVVADCYEKVSGWRQQQHICTKNNLAKQNILADFEQLSNVVTFLAEDYECSEVLPIDTASSHLAGDSVCVLTSGPHLQWHQRGWRRCLMISHVGLLPKLSQSEWIWNRVILTRHQSPVIQSFSLQSRSPQA